MHTMIKTVI